MQIEFHVEGLDFELPQKEKMQAWLKEIIKKEGSTLAELNYIFCSDNYLHQMNVDYLQHDDFTDVITFQYEEEVVFGDVFISVERTNENADKFGVSPLQELHRVMAHGLLHLLGYKDKTPDDKQQMTAKEDEALALLYK